MRISRKYLAKNLQNLFRGAIFVEPREDNRYDHLCTYNCEYAYINKAYPRGLTDLISGYLSLARKGGTSSLFSAHDCLTLTFDRNAKKSKSRNRAQSSSADSSTLFPQKSQRLGTMIGRRVGCFLTRHNEWARRTPIFFISNLHRAIEMGGFISYKAV